MNRLFKSDIVFQTLSLRDGSEFLAILDRLRSQSPPPMEPEWMECAIRSGLVRVGRTTPTSIEIDGLNIFPSTRGWLLYFGSHISFLCWEHGQALTENATPEQIQKSWQTHQALSTSRRTPSRKRC